MLAFIDTLEDKESLVERLKEHRRLDQIVQGQYWEDGGGCAVGCALTDLAGEPLFGDSHGDHAKYESVWGIPEVLAHLEDFIFEGLNEEQSKDWPVRFAQAISVGADLSLVWPKFALWMLADTEHGVLQYTEDMYGTRPAVEAIVYLFEKWANEGEQPSAARAARAAIAAAAARARATAAAATAAIAAAAAAAAAATAAARAIATIATRAAAAATAAIAAATAAIAAAAAAAIFWTAASETLITLLSEAPVACNPSEKGEGTNG